VHDYCALRIMRYFRKKNHSHPLSVINMNVCMYDHRHQWSRQWHWTYTDCYNAQISILLFFSYEKSISIAYIDFKSAFDSISHSKLLLKLTSYGIGGTYISGSRDFLTTGHNTSKLIQATPYPLLYPVVWSEVVSLAPC